VLKAALERMTAQAPDNDDYRLTLARNQTRRVETRDAGFKTLAEMSAKAGADRPRLLDIWRAALESLGDGPDAAQPLSAYLAVAPDDPALRARQQRAERQSRSKQAWEMHDRAKALLSQGDQGQAMTVLTQALSLDATNVWVRFDLLCCTGPRETRRAGWH